MLHWRVRESSLTFSLRFPDRGILPRLALLRCRVWIAPLPSDGKTSKTDGSLRMMLGNGSQAGVVLGN